jgi:hypothetical protein
LLLNYQLWTELAPEAAFEAETLRSKMETAFQQASAVILTP